MMTEEQIQSLVLYRDAGVLVIDKPAGLPVHKGPKGGETLDDHLGALRFGLERRPSLAHRLDKDTSGCLAFGRTPEAARALGRLFAGGRAQKTYWALLCGVLDRDEGRIDAPIGRMSDDPRSWWMKVDAAGQPAVTHWRVLGRGEGLTAVALTPETGRTHQLRVHTAYLGHPIAGDGIYGGPHARKIAAALLLHARRLVLPLGGAFAPVDVMAPLPAHMVPGFSACGLPA